jgi:hypothetical protein
VIGREFREGLLARVLERSRDDLSGALGALVAAEFLYESALYPEREYTFTHPLTREVAYGSQLADRRARVHAAVARALEEGDAEKLDERAAILAHHWEAAGEWFAAARWNRRAANWAYRTDLAEARRHWTQVRVLAQRLPDPAAQADLGATACAQLLTLGAWLGIGENEAAAAYEEGRTWAGATRDPRLQVAVLVGYGRFHLNQGDLRGNLELSTEALRLASASGDREAELGIRALTSFALFSLGRSREMLAEAEAAIGLASGDTRAGADFLGYSPAIFALACRGLGRVALGETESGERDIQQALALAAREPISPAMGWTNFYAAMTAWLRGDASACMRRALDALEVGGKLGLSLLESWGHLELGQAHLLGESWSDAAAALEHSISHLRSHHTGGVMEAVALDLLAEAHLGAGDTEKARALVDEAIALAKRRGTVALFRGHVTFARVLLRSAGAAARAAIEAALAEAQALVDRTEARCEQPHIHLARAELAGVLGDEGTRRRELGEAHRLFTEMGATGWAERVVKELGA